MSERSAADDQEFASGSISHIGSLLHGGPLDPDDPGVTVTRRALASVTHHDVTGP
jgi:hypothetical protein